MSTEKKETEPISEQEVINTYQTLREEVSQLFRQLNKLKDEQTEHKLVIDAIKDLDPKRKCFRLIGVLVERTVEDTLPALTRPWRISRNREVHRAARRQDRGG